jgi:hypothetical protein
LIDEFRMIARDTNLYDVTLKYSVLGVGRESGKVEKMSIDGLVEGGAPLACFSWCTFLIPFSPLWRDVTDLVMIP